jgi:hypothetical protein
LGTFKFGAHWHVGQPIKTCHGGAFYFFKKPPTRKKIQEIFFFKKVFVRVKKQQEAV